MAISVDWPNKIIHVPQADLTPKGGVLYELDVDWLRLQLKDLEDNEAGMVFLDTHQHKSESLLSGIIYARSVEIINGYVVEFEDGQYVVACVGANHNLADVKVPNQVSLIIGNAAGLIRVESGVSGLTPEESSQLMGTARQTDLLRVLGLVQENFRLKSQVYDEDGNLTDAVVRIFASSGDAEADNAPVAEYALAASFNGPGKCTGYLMRRVA